MITMNRQTILSFVAATSLIASALTAAQPNDIIEQPAKKSGYTKQETIDLINKIKEDVPFVPEKLSQLLEKINQDGSNTSFEEDLEKALKMLLSVKITPEQRTELNKVQTLLDKKLQTYKASGPIFAADFNGACFVDTQDPRFTVTYKDERGNTKQRMYQADISLIGLNVEVALRLNCIFIVGTDFDFAQTNKVIELGTGIQLSPIAVLNLFSNFFSPVKNIPELMLRPENRLTAHIVGHKNFGTLALFDYIFGFDNRGPDPIMYALSHLNLTYIPFKNISGGMFIVGVVIGADNFNLSLVKGGTLTPVTETI